MINEYAERLGEIRRSDYFNIQDAEIITGESRATLLRRIKTGSLKAHKRGGSGRWTIKKDDIEKYLNDTYKGE